MESAATPTLAQLDAELNRMIQAGQILEAFEKFYGDDIVMEDQGMGPWVGKAENREREKDFVSKITDFRAGELLASGVGEGVTYGTWHFDYTHAEWGDVKYDQVSMRTWKEGKVVRERFFRG